MTCTGGGTKLACAIVQPGGPNDIDEVEDRMPLLPGRIPPHRHDPARDHQRVTLTYGIPIPDRERQLVARHPLLRIDLCEDRHRMQSVGDLRSTSRRHGWCERRRPASAGFPKEGEQGSRRATALPTRQGSHDAPWDQRAYDSAMENEPRLEDWRGVDIGQIRAQLRLPVKERVRVMVEAANVLLDVQAHARSAEASERVDGPPIKVR